MKATTLILLQIITFIMMACLGTSLFRDTASTAIFAVSLLVFTRCSIYIEKHRKELLRDLRNERG
ncbi:MAG: hypothetical protein IKJ95_03450 [Bacteroidaceae bacterium]|nr:hypothetical protein [Bacteroidaceae bacterium]